MGCQFCHKRRETSVLQQREWLVTQGYSLFKVLSNPGIFTFAEGPFLNLTELFQGRLEPILELANSRRQQIQDPPLAFSHLTPCFLWLVAQPLPFNDSCSS